MGRQTQDRKKLIIPDFQGSLPATLSDIVAPSQRAAGSVCWLGVETLAYSPGPHDSSWPKTPSGMAC